MTAAVMGAGQWGRNWVRVLAGCRETELRWVIDPDPGARGRAGIAAPLARTAAHVDAALDEVDLVVVATPARDHFGHVLGLLRAQKHVLVEKPMTMDTAQAEELAAAAEASSVTLMVGHQLLYHPAFVRLWSAVSAGALGRLCAIRAIRTGPVDFSREPDVLWSYGPHDVAMILALTASAPLETAVSKERFFAPSVAESAHIELSFESGLAAEIDLQATDGARTRRFVVVGDRGTAVFDDSAPRARLFLLDCEPVGDPDARTEIQVASDEPLAVEYAHFTDRMRKKAEPLTGPGHAVAVTRILDGISKRLASPGPPEAPDRTAIRFGTF